MCVSLQTRCCRVLGTVQQVCISRSVLPLVSRLTLVLDGALLFNFLKKNEIGVLSVRVTLYRWDVEMWPTFALHPRTRRNPTLIVLVSRRRATLTA